MEFSECDFSDLEFSDSPLHLCIAFGEADRPSAHHLFLYWLSRIIQEAGKIASVDLPANTPFFSYN